MDAHGQKKSERFMKVERVKENRRQKGAGQKVSGVT
jgi:hypothetical protein